jgi:hypothetical protein
MLLKVLVQHTYRRRSSCVSHFDRHDMSGCMYDDREKDMIQEMNNIKRRRRFFKSGLSTYEELYSRNNTGRRLGRLTLHLQLNQEQPAITLLLSSRRNQSLPIKTSSSDLAVSSSFSSNEMILRPSMITDSESFSFFEHRFKDSLSCNPSIELTEALSAANTSLPQEKTTSPSHEENRSGSSDDDIQEYQKRYQPGNVSQDEFKHHRTLVDDDEIIPMMKAHDEDEEIPLLTFNIPDIAHEARHHHHRPRNEDDASRSCSRSINRTMSSFESKHIRDSFDTALRSGAFQSTVTTHNMPRVVPFPGSFKANRSRSRIRVVGKPKVFTMTLAQRLREAKMRIPVEFQSEVTKKDARHRAINARAQKSVRFALDDNQVFLFESEFEVCDELSAQYDDDEPSTII